MRGNLPTLNGVTNNLSVNANPNGNAVAPAVAAATLATGIPAWKLMLELQGTVPTFGGTKVRVGFFGSDAFVDMKRGYVNLPKLPQAMIIPNSIAMEIRGFGMHEASHLLWTDNEFMENGRTPEEKNDRLLHSIWNAIEDFMIERNFLEIYRGAHKNFTATEARCCAGYMELYRKVPDVPKDWRAVGSVALTWARSIYFGLQTPSSQDCINTLSPAFQQKLWQWFMMIENVADTQECWELAKVITAEIRANPIDPNDPPSQPLDSNPNYAPRNKGGSGAGGSAGGGGAGSAGGGAKNGGGGKGGTGAPGQTSSTEPAPLSPDRSIDEAMAEIGGADTETLISSPFVETATAGDPDENPLLDQAGAAYYTKVRAQTSGIVGTLSNALKRALQTATKTQIQRNRMDGKLDTRRLAKLLMGSNEVYTRRKEGFKIDTALSILVDCSGSMDETIGLCQEMAIALDAALAGTPVKVEILGYTTDSDDKVDDHTKLVVESVKANGGEIDCRAIRIFEFKRFDAPMMVLRQSLGNMHNCATGGTPTGDGIYIALSRLNKRPERRHVMFVLTDGAPDDNDRCKESVKVAEAAGVTVIGFGIQSDSVRRAFTNWILLSDLKDLGAQVIGRIATILFSDRKKTPVAVRMPSHITSVRQAA